MFGLIKRGFAPFPAAALAAVLAVALPGAAAAYQPITPDGAGRTVVITGDSLTLDQLNDIARHGAKVQLSPAAIQRAKDTHGLLLQAAAEGVPVYLFNRGGGNGRENTTFTGDPMSAENKARLETNQLNAFRNGARAGSGPEEEDEGLIRAVLAVRLNAIGYDAPSQPLLQGLADLLNHRVTPVIRSPTASVGEADIGVLQSIGGTLVGRGDAYYNGVRMPAAQALQQAGLKPIAPFGVDNIALSWSNAYQSARAALLAYDARSLLEWTDMVYAMDLLGMNSSITPLAAPTQLNRPDPWLNWHASRMLGMLRGSYLFEVEAAPKRIIQDPDSLRASSIRGASAWAAWSDLKDAVLVQINSSDHNPTIRVGLKPTDSWELSTPQMMQYYVKGGPNSGGKSGYIVSTANWDPFPMANRVEAFVIALANLDIAVLQRNARFSNNFHTGVNVNDVLSAEIRANTPPQGNGTAAIALFGWVESLMNPQPLHGFASDIEGTSDLESNTPIKIIKAQSAVDYSLQLLAHDLMTAAYWMDLRKVEGPQRSMAAGPAAALAAYRQVSPWQAPAAQRPERPGSDLAVQFLRTHRAVEFWPALAQLPPK
jgi:histidine ammonia-lyase